MSFVYESDSEFHADDSGIPGELANFRSSKYFLTFILGSYKW